MHKTKVVCKIAERFTNDQLMLLKIIPQAILATSFQRLSTRFGGRHWHGPVNEINAGFDPDSSSFEFEIEIDSTEKEIEVRQVIQEIARYNYGQ